MTFIRRYYILIIILVVVACCFIFIAALAIGGYVLLKNTNEINSSLSSTPTAPVVEEITPKATDNGPAESMKTLEQQPVPENDLRELASRLEAKSNIPATLPEAAPVYKIGDEQKFWVSNEDTNKQFQVDFVLRFKSDHLYFWIEKGLTYKEESLTKLGNAFETKIYPMDRKFFGSEWTPGIDNDPHLYVLYARNLGKNIAGYFSSLDSIHPLAHEYSNAHEMFKLNADSQTLEAEYTYSVLAHEFQHMIHWNRDRNEDTWVNEGFSELAVLLNGYDTGGFDGVYARNPDIQLNDWPNDHSSTSPHYGASFLFMTYFLDRFGDKATQVVVGDPENGLESIDKVMKELAIKDPKTQKQIGADDIFADWVLATFIKDKKVEDGRFVYNIYPQVPQLQTTEKIKTCPVDIQKRLVNQYGVDFITVECLGNYTLSFEGSNEVGLTPADAHSGNYFFWSNKGDESDMTLTRSFDFSNVKSPISLSYWTWYDLEKDYDYLFLEVSEDGSHWEILKTPSCTSSDPSGNSYGCGYNGESRNWIREEVDLSKYTGKKVQIRFEYITDAAVNGEGFLLDDISVSAAGYSNDFEKDAGGWKANGFVRIQNRLPQTFRLSLITQGRTTKVQYLTLNADQSLKIPLVIGGDVTKVVLAVSGTTRFTRQPAVYRFNIQP